MIGTLETRQTRSVRVGKGDKRGKAFKPLPKLGPTKAGQAHPRDRRGTGARSPVEDARLTALDARARHLGGLTVLTVPAEFEGIGPPEPVASVPERSRLSVTGPHLCEPLGQVMQKACADAEEIARLWAVWQAFCAAMRTYRVRIIGRGVGPQNSAIPMLPERIEVDPGHTIDTRTAEERDDDAMRAYRRWQGHLGQLFGGDRAYLMQAESGMGRPLFEGQAATRWGRFTLEALRHLADVVEKEQPRRSKKVVDGRPNP